MNHDEGIKLILEGLAILLDRPKLKQDAKIIAYEESYDLSSALNYCIVNHYLKEKELDMIFLY
jgi:hypothetical protein